GCLAKNLGHHTVYITPFGNTMSVSSVRTGNRVTLFQVRTHPGGYCLFASVQMYKPWNSPTRELFSDPRLEGANHRHCLIEMQNCVPVERHWLLLKNICYATLQLETERMCCPKNI